MRQRTKNWVKSHLYDFIGAGVLLTLCVMISSIRLGLGIFLAIMVLLTLGVALKN
jgi:hypothetical protein